MKFLSLFPAILIAFQITPSLSAPTSTPAGPKSLKRQSSTFAQGDCASQQISGQPEVTSGDCGQGDRSESSAGGLIPTIVDSENNTTNNATSNGEGMNGNVNVGGTAGKNRGVVSGSKGGSLTGNNRGTMTGNEGSTALGNGVGNGQGNNGAGNGIGNGQGTTDRRPGTQGSDTVSIPHTSTSSSGLLDSFIANLKGTSSRTNALPQLNAIISRLKGEFSSGQNSDVGQGGAVAATAFRKRYLDNQGYNSVLYAEEHPGEAEAEAEGPEAVEQSSGDLQGGRQQGAQNGGSNGCIGLVTGGTGGDVLRCAPGGQSDVVGAGGGVL